MPGYFSPVGRIGSKKALTASITLMPSATLNLFINTGGRPQRAPATSIKSENTGCIGILRRSPMTGVNAA
ncbi:hypothetical protein OH818_01495 [Jiella pelagia]|uniref:Uncharacterized protein n=1 Tax=Jiella pelagia TaxID=2986949 RepID=A0ABY7BZN5_9HYPH|nr:hypothetical protein OH818_01495 [Jiella pelagia]